MTTEVCPMPTQVSPEVKSTDAVCPLPGTCEQVTARLVGLAMGTEAVSARASLAALGWFGSRLSASVDGRLSPGSSGVVYYNTVNTRLCYSRADMPGPIHLFLSFLFFWLRFAQGDCGPEGNTSMLDDVANLGLGVYTLYKVIRLFALYSSCLWRRRL